MPALSDLAFDLRYRAVRLAAQAIVPRVFASRSSTGLRTMARLFEKVSATDVSRERARKMLWLFEQEHPFEQWMKRVATELAPGPRSRWVNNIYVNQFFLSKMKRERFRAAHGFYPPHFITVSPLGACNYRCEGCWAGEYSKKDELPVEVFDKVVGEARDVFGNHWVTLTGGEPLIRRDLFPVYRKYNDVFFLMFTNGSLLTEEVADELADIGNVGPMVSVEGWEDATDARRGKGAWERAGRAMEKLKRRGIPFGYAVTACRTNVDDVSSVEFADDMISRGALYGWYFHYVPIGRNPQTAPMLTPEQRNRLRLNLYRIRNTRPIFLVDFWNDGPETGGCLAGGQCYLHVNPKGDIEPCVFVHLAVDNVHQKTMTDALKSPFFRDIRSRIPYDGNELRPCMIIDRPKELRELYATHRPRPTHRGAEDYIVRPDICGAIDEHSAGYRGIVDPAWIAGDWERILPDPPAVNEFRIAEAGKLADRVAAEARGEKLPAEKPMAERLAAARREARAGRKGKPAEAPLTPKPRALACEES